MPKFDQYDGPTTNANGDFVPEYHMFVDDFLGAIMRHQGKTRQLIASSIVPVYLLIGNPGQIKNPSLPPTMAWDKMED